MNYKMVKYILGQMMKVNGFLMIIPFIVSLIYAEHTTFAFLPPVIMLMICGALLGHKVPDRNNIYAKEGMVIVALSWIIFSAFGAAPFVISGQIPSVVDAFFETVSGFTTTGSTILTEIESLPKGILFWRSFTHWIGGMGVLVFALAVLPQSNSRSMHLMKAEVPGPTVGKLVSRMRNTAQILYGIYIAITIIEIILLYLGKMPLYDSIVTAFSTAGTGGFAVTNTSIAHYDSYYIDMVVAIFMLIFGVNFNLYFFILTKNFAEAFRSEELHWYLGIMFTATIFIMLSIHHLYGDVAQTFRYAFFQVSSIMTSTGFATADYMQWSSFAQAIMMILMMIGACAGSTGGGLKVARILILFKTAVRRVKKNLHPNWVMPITLDDKSLEDDVIYGTGTYIGIFFIIFSASVLGLTALGLDMETAFGAVNGTINNIGPGLKSVGPVGNFAHLSAPMKLILCFDMLAGRLELFPVLALFTLSTWKK